MFKAMAFSLLLASATLTTAIFNPAIVYAESVPLKVMYYQEPAAQAVFDNIPEYYVATLANAEANGTWIAFLPQGKILKDFRILQLEYQEGGESLAFKTSTIFHYATLQQPLMLKTLLESTIPTVGYSYTNAHGDTETYSLSISGMDGSLITQRILVV